MTNQYRNVSSFDLIEFWNVLKEKFHIILIVSVIAASISWGYSFWGITPQYEADINMIVNTYQNTSAVVTNDNIVSAMNLVDTYAIIIKSNTVLNRVIEQLDLPINYDTLYSKVQVKAINNTQIMRITVRDSDPELAVKIVQAISEIAPAILVDAVEAGSCKAVSQVRLNPDQVSPDGPKIVIISVFLAVVAAMAFILLKELLNDKIIDDVDIHTKLDLPVLGVIPSLEME